MKSLVIPLVFLLSACSISPGMKAPSASWLGQEVVYLDDYNDEYIKVERINSELINKQIKGLDLNEEYRISSGDILTITVWGQPDAFPALTYQKNSPQNARTVGSDGNIFFPYIGSVRVKELTVNQAREKITNLLSKDFIEPQVDVTITHYNANRNIYVVGEIAKLSTLVLGIEPISLSEAIVRSGGLKPNTSAASSVYVIRHPYNDYGPQIFKADLSTPDQFIASGQFFLRPRDIVFVGAADITKWNRVISQFFPFASFINQIDSITED